MVKLPTRRSAGFTLLEVLVAVTVLGIIAVLGWRALDGITRARETLTRDLETTRGLQLSFAQLQSDCEHIALNYDLGGRSALALEPQRLTLIRNVQTDTQATALQVVAYRVKDGVLYRRESQLTRDLRELEMMWRATLGETDPAQPVKLQEGVTGMVMQTWYQDGGWRVSNGEIAANPGGPVGPAGAQGPVIPANVPTGLQVALQVRGMDGSMTKNFMLGAI